MPLVAPSLLFADFNRTKHWLPQLEEAGADMLQWDIMDNRYVPNTGNKIKDIKFLRPKTRIFFDCHLMVLKPQKYFKKLQDFGADSITFHVETTKDPKNTIKKICDLGMGTGIALNNDLDVKKIFPFLPFVDIALVMSVQAGFGSQEFIPSSLEKVKILRKKINKEKLCCKIQIDGGINLQTGAKAVNAGADILVAGSFVFKHKNPKEAVLALKKL
ncbi:MAG: ribulose-phosphate 3-epimerase [Candidatus Diapherotrites archaeon]|nr:ribulose-phosphate 3-epimerase [Candidatus Diapherotrites archaeon]